jgi:CspA family cold shock protein
MSEFADKMLVCERCQRSFVFTVTEQRRLTRDGVEVYEPRYCPQCRQEDEGQVKLIGEVKWFSNDKGYGFIRKADGQEVFVHHSGIVGSGFKTLEEGQQVEFRVERTDRGPQAVDVVLLS